MDRVFPLLSILCARVRVRVCDAKKEFHHHQHDNCVMHRCCELCPTVDFSFQSASFGKSAKQKKLGLGCSSVISKSHSFLAFLSYHLCAHCQPSLSSFWGGCFVFSASFSPPDVRTQLPRELLVRFPVRAIKPQKKTTQGIPAVLYTFSYTYPGTASHIINLKVC